MLLTSPAARAWPSSRLMAPRSTCAATSPSTESAISTWLSTLALRSSNIMPRMIQTARIISASIASQAAARVPQSF